MIFAANFSSELFKSSQELNTKLAYKHGAEKVFQYGYDDLSTEFKEEVKDILKFERGGGNWVWKPYVVLDALNRIDEGDYLIYTDSGSAAVASYKHLVKAMDNAKVCIMPFVMSKQDFNESRYTKRDTFVYMGLDDEKYTKTPQIWAGIQAYKKCDESVAFVREWLDNCKNIDLISDLPNKCGLDNYPDFEDHRYDQSIYSLLCKKYELKMFRDPSVFRRDYNEWYADDVVDRSPYPQIFDAHRNGKIKSEKELTWKKKYLTAFYWKSELRFLLQKNGKKN